jgi:hypothetical protein
VREEQRREREGGKGTGVLTCGDMMFPCTFCMCLILACSSAFAEITAPPTVMLCPS